MAKNPTKGAFKAKALLIDTKPTAYNTRFRKNALYQVADKINNDGLPLLLVHDSSKLPVGAWYEANVDEPAEALMTKFFIPQEVKEYEDVKTRVEADILDAVSIGFRADKHDCSICGNDIQNYEECPHIPGQKYEVKDPQSGASLGEQTCYVMLDDIQASEASLVYSGAVPAAKIVESSNKENYFTQNKINFDERITETIYSAAILQDKSINNNEGEDGMEEEFKELKIKYQELTDKFNTSREDNIGLKELNFEFKEKVEAYDQLLTDKEALQAQYDADVKSLGEKVESLAAPFDVDYKAPSTVAELLADLDTYIEKAKALPSGQQSQTEDEELAYSEPDEVYKV